MAFLPWKFKEGGYQPAEATIDEHRPGSFGSLLTTIESLFGEPGTHEPMNIHAAYLYTCIFITAAAATTIVLTHLGMTQTQQRILH